MYFIVCFSSISINVENNHQLEIYIRSDNNSWLCYIVRCQGELRATQEQLEQTQLELDNANDKVRKQAMYCNKKLKKLKTKQETTVEALKQANENISKLEDKMRQDEMRETLVKQQMERGHNETVRLTISFTIYSCIQYLFLTNVVLSITWKLYKWTHYVQTEMCPLSIRS